MYDAFVLISQWTSPHNNMYKTMKQHKHNMYKSSFLDNSENLKLGVTLLKGEAANEDLTWRLWMAIDILKG